MKTRLLSLALAAVLTALSAAALPPGSETTISAIRMVYSNAQKAMKENGANGTPRYDTEVESHYVIPACGETTEVIHYFYDLEYDEAQSKYFNKVYFITRRYNITFRQYYEEYLYNSAGELVFILYREDDTNGRVTNLRYYFDDGECFYYLNDGEAEPDAFAIGMQRAARAAALIEAFGLINSNI